MKLDRLFKQFNWRFLLVRILVNALALAITAAITPKIYFVDKSVWAWLLMACTLGVLNALLKPLLQFLTLQFIFVTYGLVIVLVNALILMLLSFLFPMLFAVDNLLWALVGGLVLGLISSFLESLLGLTMPIVPDEPPELRRQVEERANQVDWLAAANNEAVPEEQVPAMESPAREAEVAEPAAAEPAAAEPAVAESSTPGPKEAPSPPAEVETEPSLPGISADPEPARTDSARGPREDQEEDRS